MKTFGTSSVWKRVDGSALMAAAIAAAVLGIMVVSYLTWVTNEYRFSKRSNLWAEALYLAEAGSELGCAELNFPYRQGGSAFLTDNGWTMVGGDAYQKTVTGFTDSSGNTIGNLAVLVSGVSGTNPVIRGIGTATAAQGPATSRAIQIWLKKRSSYSRAIVAKRQITMNGGSYIDSFDSSDPSKSTGGQYDPAKRQANGGVASISSSEQAILADTIYGTAATGSSGTMLLTGSIGPTLDSSQRVTTPTAAESKGWLTHDFDLEVPNVTLPAGLSSTYNLGAIKTMTRIPSGNWQAQSLDSTSPSRPIIIDGHVRLYVTGTIRISGGGYLEISPGGSLELYVGGDVSVSGNGVVNNNGLARNNVWYGLPSSTTWAVTGNGQWVGIVYAPQVSATFGSSNGVCGSFVVDNLTVTGGSGLHYDESLAGWGGGVNRGYTAGTWQELRYVNGSWVP